MKIDRVTLFLIIIILLTTGVNSVQAQNAQALIDEVNGLRVSYGLEPYVVDAALMVSAQAHSDYQSDIKTFTHDRADGSTPPCRSENICAVADLTANYCVKTMWTDQLHLYTMIGLDSGTVGAGYAVNEGMHYYTLQVNSSGKETDMASLAAVPTVLVSANENAAESAIDISAYPVQPGGFATSTPELDGSVYHIVQSNETLWTIAVNYGTTIARLQELNGKTGDDVNVYAGQRILIVYGGTVVPETATPTSTKPPATNTPKPTSTITLTPLPMNTLTPTITMTPTPQPLIRHIDFFDSPAARPFGLTLVILCGLGLAATLYFGFFRHDE